jgi:hypothetical protein
MKKLLGVISIAPIYLASAVHVFAQESVNPCDGNPTGILGVACAGKDNSLGQVIGFIVAAAFIIAILVALLFLIWGGIKWITSGGDKAGVEAARNQIISAIIGLIVVFLAFFILNLVLQLFGTSLFDLTLPTFSGTS